jgi:hypothetical protein
MWFRHVEIDGLSAGDNNQTVSLPTLLNPRLGRQMPGVGRRVTWRGRGALSYIPWVRRSERGETTVRDYPEDIFTEPSDVDVQTLRNLGPLTE